MKPPLCNTFAARLPCPDGARALTRGPEHLCNDFQSYMTT